MSSNAYRFTRPDDLELVEKPHLTVAVVIACRGGQEKLHLVLASLAAQTYPSKLTSTYIIDDGSEFPIELPKIHPKNAKVIYYKNSAGKWGKTTATNDVAARLKEDVLWFIDADMVFDPDHLSHHMKWHHHSDDYAVLGWKRFVDSWNYTPDELFKSLNNGDFLDLHSQSWGKELWEERVNRTQDLTEPGIDGYRSFVGATFSIANSRWKKLGGYNRELITGEDTELGWRVFMSGMRTVVDRQAHSWHLGHSTVEKNKSEIQRHNEPSLAQFIPQMHSIRAKFPFSWKVPTYQVLVDLRNSTLEDLMKIDEQLLDLKGTTAHFTLLAPWSSLAFRYSPVSDERADLREIYNWLKGDERFTMLEIEEKSYLTIDHLLSYFSPSATPYHLFIESSWTLNLKELVDLLSASGNGMVGVANKDDHRAFALFAPALARAVETPGNTYANIASQFGLLWITEENFLKRTQGKDKRLRKIIRYLKREGKKINSLRQLTIFLKKSTMMVIRKIVRRG